MSKLKYKVGDRFESNQNDFILTIEKISNNHHDVYNVSNNLNDCEDNVSEHYLDAYHTKIEDTEQVGGTHYSKLAIEPYEYSYKNNLNCFQFNIIKYVTRYPFKNGIEDLEKAKHTIERLIQEEKNKL